LLFGFVTISLITSQSVDVKLNAESSIIDLTETTINSTQKRILVLENEEEPPHHHLPPERPPPPELKMDKIYKDGMMRICETIRKIPIISQITLFGRINVTLVLDYANKSSIKLDDERHPSKSKFLYCMMYLDVYMNEKFVFRTDNFKMENHVDTNLYTFKMGFIEELFNLNHPRFVKSGEWDPLGDKRWKYLSKEWTFKQIDKFEEGIESSRKVQSASLFEFIQLSFIIIFIFIIFYFVSKCILDKCCPVSDI